MKKNKITYLFDIKNEIFVKVFPMTFPDPDGEELMLEYPSGDIEFLCDSGIKYRNGEFVGCRKATRKEFNQARREVISSFFQAGNWDKPLTSGVIRLGDLIDIYIENIHTRDEQYNSCVVTSLGLYPMVKYEGQLISIIDMLPVWGNISFDRKSCKKQLKKIKMTPSIPLDMMQLSML